MTISEGYAAGTGLAIGHGYVTAVGSTNFGYNFDYIEDVGAVGGHFGVLDASGFYPGGTAYAGDAIGGMQFYGGLYISGGLSVDLTSEVAGSLPVANGGTGQTSLTTGQVLVGNGTSAVDQLTSTRTSGETLELKLGSDRWIGFSAGSF